MAASSYSASLALLLVLGVYAAAGALAANYPVGSNGRWDVPSGSENYTTWAAGQQFAVGDFLVFNFATGAHDARQVSQSDYSNCNSQNPLASYNTGPATVPLNTAGTFYYLCSVGSHCSLGQKMIVTVSAATSPTTPSSPAPTAGGPATPATPSVPTSPGPSGSGSGTPPPPPGNAAPPAGLGKTALATVALTASAAALLL